MRNEKLRGVFEDMGFENVQTVIFSGNVLFETESKSRQDLEAVIEKALQEQLGFSTITIIRSKNDLNQFIKRNPFNSLEDTPKSKLNVTFLKNEPKREFEFPYHSDNNGFVVLGIHDRAICSVVDMSLSKTPNLMRWLEKEFGKELTTRTWKTVGRIVTKLTTYK
jgi:uncharacterized protein (DUF1697 family)